MGLWLSGLHERLYFARGGRSICEAKVNESEIRYYHGTLLRLNKRNKKKSNRAIAAETAKSKLLCNAKRLAKQTTDAIFSSYFLGSKPRGPA